MKKIALLLIVLPLIASCTGQKKESKDTDTTPEFVKEAELAIDTITLPSLTPEGLGPVRVGMVLDSVPQGVVGLYDRIERDATPDAEVYNFMMGEETMFSVLDFGSSHVDVICLSSPRIAARGAGGELHLGDPMSTLVSKPGISTEYVSLDDSGLWYWRLDGLWYNVNEAECTPQTAQMLESRQTPPKSAQLPADIRIGYIGTGSPY